MFSRRTGAAVAAAGAIALGALAGCASSTSTAVPTTPATSTSHASAAAFNTADVAFTNGMITLNMQASMLASITTGRTGHTELDTMAAHMRDYATDNDRMRSWMHDWHHAPASPAPSGNTSAWPWAGPGMMGPGRWHDWDDMSHMNGHMFDADWIGAAIAINNAMIAQCRAELTGGINPAARALAAHTLTQRQTDLTQLESWYNTWTH